MEVFIFISYLPSSITESNTMRMNHKKLFTVILVLFFGIKGFSVELNDSSKTHTSAHAVGISISGGYCCSLFFPDGIDRTNSGGGVYAAALSYRLRLTHTNRLFLYTDLGYSQNTIHQSHVPNPFDPTIDAGPSSFCDAITRYNFLFVRERIAYSFWEWGKNKRNGLFIIGGLQTNWNYLNTEMLSNFTSFAPPVVPNKQILPQNNTRAACIFGLAYSLNMAHGLSVNIIPELCFDVTGYGFLGQVPNNSPPHFCSSGAELQLLYRF